MIHKAKDLSPDQKPLIENLLGRRVLEDEAISVRAFEPPALSDERRREIAEELKRYFAEIDAQRKPGSREEVQMLSLELQQRRLRRDLQRFDEEDAEAERKRAEAVGR